MSQFCCITSCAQPSIEEWSSLPMLMRSSSKHAWRSASAMRSPFLRLGQIKIMCISSFSQCHSTAQRELSKSSKALRPEKSTRPVQRSRSSYGAASSGAMDTSSAQLDSTATRPALRSTSVIKAQNTRNCIGSNSTYSDTPQLAAVQFISLTRLAQSAYFLSSRTN